jgi:signal transduction histidine kinase
MNDVPDFIMDEKEIRQLLLNLTRNAFEAMEPGDKLTIATNSKNGKAFLQIRDTGMGIPQNILVRLGTPFLTTKENGTGLGLAVCYRIADRHGAEIDVRTSPAGTTFTISFPV